jgi:hypothetical protein
MKIYRYSLDKSSKKFICPRCHKRTFVKFVENDTGNYLNEEFGRCDRETNCGYYCTAKTENNSTFEVQRVTPTPPSFHNLELVDKSMNEYMKNNFIRFLNSIFSKDAVNNAIRKYLLGTSKFWNGATVFWQIDINEQVHAGKILQYDLNTGKRCKTKSGRGLINWVHSVLKIEDFNLNQCLFGLHLISETNQKSVAVVESEKTAVIMSIFKPKYVWLSTGSKQGLKYEMLKYIKKFKIIAFPDKGEYFDWLKKAEKLNALGFQIEVNDWLEKLDCVEGTDLADIYVSECKGNSQKSYV